MKSRSRHLDTQTRDRLLSIGFPILLLALWEMAVRLKWLDARFFPAPSTVAIALWDLTANGELLGKFWELPGRIWKETGPGPRRSADEGHVWAAFSASSGGFCWGLFRASLWASSWG